MKIAIFFDGQNFYRSLLRYDESLRVDYDRLATWITQQVGGPGALFSGAYYYVGVSADAPPLVEGFLRGLELRPGYYDFVPAVEAVNALGKQVWVATWSAEGLSKDLRVKCFGHIHLSDGVSVFRVERRPYERAPGRAVPSRPARPAAPPASSSELERGLQELQRAEARLPHVSRGYFVMRWKSHALPPVGPEREALVQELIDLGLAEEFEVRDVEGRQVTAIRRREPDGNVREPDGHVTHPEEGAG